MISVWLIQLYCSSNRICIVLAEFTPKWINVKEIVCCHIIVVSLQTSELALFRIQLFVRNSSCELIISCVFLYTCLANVDKIQISFLRSWENNHRLYSYYTADIAVYALWVLSCSETDPCQDPYFVCDFWSDIYKL